MIRIKIQYLQFQLQLSRDRQCRLVNRKLIRSLFFRYLCQQGYYDLREKKILTN